MIGWQRGVTFSVMSAILLYAVLAFAELGSVSPRCAAKFPKWFGCVLASHETLAGSLIAFAGALFAGWLAWTAVQHQITAERELAVRQENATYDVVRSELREMLDLIALIWRVVDHALTDQTNEQLLRNGVSLVRALYPGIIALKDLSGAEEVSKQLDPRRQQEFVDVMIGLRALFNHFEYERELEDRWWLLTMRIQLSHLNHYLQAFDPMNAQAIFGGRTLVPVDHRGTAAHLAPLVEQYEREGRI
ncbi:MAG: hypothetical protein AB7K35_09225 [Pseudorhodoplanes sp.]